jgi:hypothetical protein
VVEPGGGNAGAPGVDAAGAVVGLLGSFDGGVAGAVGFAGAGLAGVLGWAGAPAGGADAGASLPGSGGSLGGPASIAITTIGLTHDNYRRR